MCGNNEGMVGKLNQHNDIFIENMDNLPAATQIISRDLIDKLDNSEIVPKHRGSMGIIYQGKYEGKNVSIKVIPDNIKDIVNNETSALNFVNLLSMINKSIVDVAEDLQLRIRNELKMDLEYSNYCLIRKHHLHPFGGRTVDVIHPLCDSSHFVYIYEQHNTIDKCISSLTEEKKVDIYTRIISMYFKLQLDNIFIGDLNCGNFLYNIVDDEIIVIDYGCIIEINERFSMSMDILIFNLMYAEDTTYLTDTFCNGSRKCKILIDQFHYLLSDVETDFSTLQLDLSIFDLSAISGSKFIPETVTVLRSIAHFLLLAKKMEIKINIRHILEKNKQLDYDPVRYQPRDINELFRL